MLVILPWPPTEIPSPRVNVWTRWLFSVGIGMIILLRRKTTAQCAEGEIKHAVVRSHSKACHLLTSKVAAVESTSLKRDSQRRDIRSNLITAYM